MALSEDDDLAGGLAAVEGTRGAWRRLGRPPPAVAVVLGAVCIAFTSQFVALAHTSAGTASFFRCAFALPVLLALAAIERHRRGARTWGQRAVPLAAGALLGGDLLLWSQAVGEVGAGISTVVVNAQVVLVPLLALAVDREPLNRRFGAAVVPMLVGVALASGVGVQAFGADPLLGTVHATLAALFYAGYLFLLRRGGRTGHLAGPLFDVTLSAGAVSLVVGAAWHGVDLAPGWRTLGWLLALALSGQVAGWLLVAIALPRLATRVGSALLLVQPVGAVLLGAVLLSQHPALVQLAGCVLVLVAVVVATGSQGPRPAYGVAAPGRAR
jgi:drug/metabolite transporter (DMT)-like permease